VNARAGIFVVTAAVLAGETLAPLWPVALRTVATPPLAVLAVWFAGGRRRPPLLWLVVALSALALGLLRGRPVGIGELPGDHVAHLIGVRKTRLEGEVVRSPARRGDRLVLVIAASHAERDGVRRPVTGLIRVGIRRPTLPWTFGDRLRLEARLRRPRNFENPGRFDWEGHLARRGIHAMASVWDETTIVRTPGRVPGGRARLERWRARLGTRIAATLPGREGAILQALVIGDDGAIAAGLREAFTRAGVVHVLSISGLHIGLVAALGFASARWLLGRSERVLLRIDVDRAAAVASLGPVLLYTALAGLGVATLRAALMVGVAVAAGVVGRRVDVSRSLALAALAIAVVWPGAPREIAFQLSFVSVAAIVAGVERLAPVVGRGRSWRARLLTAALASLCALVGTAPLTAFHFHQVSLAGLVANPLVIPLFGSAVVGVGLTGAVLEPLAPDLAVIAFRAAGAILSPGIALVEALAAPTWAALDVPMPTSAELLVLYTLLGALLLRPRRVAGVVAGLAVLALVVDAGWWVRERKAPSRLRVTFLDVGQGDAVVAELPGGRVLVVDAGGFPGSDFDTGAAVVAPFLYRQKILRLDVLAMTHAHPDHSGGLPSLVVGHRPREFWWTGVAGRGHAWERLQGALAGSGTPVRVLGDGGVAPGMPEVTVLHPPVGGTDLSLNDSSLTLRLTLGAVSILLTGDIEAAAEARLGDRRGELGSVVLKVPHHGSRTSSSEAFLDAVAARVAVVSVGAENRYGLPASRIEARYRARGTCLLRTDRCGAIAVETDGRRLTVTAMRPECSCPAPTGVDRPLAPGSRLTPRG
jgi:competence protein ComEC